MICVNAVINMFGIRKRGRNIDIVEHVHLLQRYRSVTNNKQFIVNIEYFICFDIPAI